MNRGLFVAAALVVGTFPAMAQNSMSSNPMAPNSSSPRANSAMSQNLQQSQCWKSTDTSKPYGYMGECEAQAAAQRVDEKGTQANAQQVSNTRQSSQSRQRRMNTISSR